MTNFVDERLEVADRDMDPIQWTVFSDDFSVQVSLSADALFWIRVERPYAEYATITDCKRSAQSDQRVAEALNLALTASGRIATLRHLHFTDIAPGRGRATGEAEAAQLAAIVTTMYSTGVKRILNWKTRVRGEKIDLVIELDADQS